MPVVDMAGALKEAYGVDFIDKEGDSALVSKPNPNYLVGPLNETNNMRDTQQQQMKISLNSVAKELQLPPDTQMQFGRREAPVNQNVLGFRDQMDFAMAENTTDRMRLLRDKYGADAVNYNKDTKEFAVKYGDTWHKADAGLMAGIANDRKSLAGMLIGSQIGAGLGTGAAPGPGTAVGGVVGGAVGAAIGKGLSLLEAHSRGIRTDLDAQEVGKELGKEFAVNLAFGAAAEGVVPAVKAGGELVEKALGKIGRSSTPAVKEIVANVDAMLSGNEVVDSMTNLDSPKQVGKYVGESVDYLRGNQQGVHPVEQKMSDMMFSTLQGVKEHEQQVLLATSKKLAPVMDAVKVDMQPAFSQLHQQFQQLGLVDAAGNWIESDPLKYASISSEENQQAMKNAWERLHKTWKGAEKPQEAAAQAAGIEKPNLNIGNTLQANITGKDYLKMKGALDDVYDGMQAFKDTYVSPAARQQAVAARNITEQNFMQELAKKDVAAANEYFYTNQRYSAKRAIMSQMEKGGVNDPAKVFKFTKSFLGKGAAGFSRDAFETLVADTPYADKGVVDQLFQMRAGVNKAPLVSAWKPTRYVGSVARGGARLTQATLDGLVGAAHGIEFLRNMPKDQLAPMLQDPLILRGLFNVVNSAQDTHDQVKDHLLGGGG